MKYFATCDVTYGKECYMGRPYGHWVSGPELMSLEECEALVERHLTRNQHPKRPRIYQEDGILVSGPAPDKQSMPWLREINTPRNPENEPE